jgi:DNA-binding response OmpR family regulator
MKKAKILVIDDELQIRELLKEFLQLKGYTVITASNGDEALTCMQDQQLMLAVLDMCMPGKNGLETLRSMRTLNPHLSVIMLTGICDEAAVR